MNLEVLIVGTPAVPVFEPTLSADALAAKDGALATSALIGKVTNRAENDAANNARKALREVSGALDRQRKKMTDPFVEAQRLLIRTVEPHIDELKQEDARLELLVKDFTLQEQRRIREEQEAQERELARIERERQAELHRIQAEQDRKERERQAELRRIQLEQERVEREAREAREAAERAAREATNKAQREAAAKAQQEAEAKRREADAAAALAAKQVEAVNQAADRIAEFSAQQTQIVNDRADLNARIESKPVEITRAHGQTNRKVWKITQINDFLLMKARPDLVRKIEWDMVAIKQALSDGVKLAGVTAEEDLSIGVRGKATRTIDI